MTSSHDYRLEQDRARWREVAARQARLREAGAVASGSQNEEARRARLRADLERDAAALRARKEAERKAAVERMRGVMARTLAEERNGWHIVER